MYGGFFGYRLPAVGATGFRGTEVVVVVVVAVDTREEEVSAGPPAGECFFPLLAGRFLLEVEIIELLRATCGVEAAVTLALVSVWRSSSEETEGGGEGGGGVWDSCCFVDDVVDEVSSSSSSLSSRLSLLPFASLAPGFGNTIARWGALV